MRPWWRRPPFGPHGQKVVAIGCVWEVLALIDGVPIPTISETVSKRPWFGWFVLGLLAHHWWLEAEEALFDDIVTAPA